MIKPAGYENAVSINLEGSCNVVTSIGSVDDSIPSNMQGRAGPSDVNVLQLYLLKWAPYGSVRRAVPHDGY